MKIYDSATGTLNTLLNKDVTIYNCGPTVYNDVHIGNIRPLVTFDVLYRFLKYQSYNVKLIHNITDIDDKIIERARQENKSEKEISTYYYEEYLKIVNQLNVLPMQMPKVSDNIFGIIDYVKKLIDTNHAYEVDGDVYFDIKSISSYGYVSHQSINDLLNAPEQENNSKKKFSLDFALWKKTDLGLNWKSPWSQGRPGWHTECAFFINNLVGDHVTIHGGGIDLRFPHHENENAQNVALTNRNIADYFMHVGHITINNEKMSKSLNNFFIVKDLLKEFNANDLRWFLYQTQYSKPLNFSIKLLKDSSDTLKKIFQQLNNVYIQMLLNNYQYKQTSTSLDSEFINYLNNDLDFANAISVIHAQVKSISKLIKNKNFNELNTLLDCIVAEFDILGIKYENPINGSQVSSIIVEWKKSLNEKNYILADKYRQQLIDMGVL